MEWITYKTNVKRTPQSEEAYNKLSKKNRDAIDRWLFEKSINSKSEKRAGNRKRAVIKLLTFVKKDYNKITYDDYVLLASAISKSKIGVEQKNGDKFFIKRFLKDNYEDWARKFKGFELLKGETKGEDEKIQPDDLLTELEIDRMIKATTDMKKQGLIVVLSSSGCRPEEALKLKWNDVDFKKELIYLYSAKTRKKRHVPIGSAINHLSRLYKEIEPQADDLLFATPSKKIMTNAGLNLMLQKIGEKAGITKKMHGYIFRHTRLSYLITVLDPKTYEEISGHSLQTGLSTYAHLSQDKIIKNMEEKVFKAERVTPKEKNILKELKEENKKIREDLDRVINVLTQLQDEQEAVPYVLTVRNKPITI